MTDTSPALNRGFHAKNGWYFAREQDGVVRVFKERGDHSVVVDFDANTWASIIASVSASGENADTWHRALELHGGQSWASHGST